MDDIEKAINADDKEKSGQSGASGAAESGPKPTDEEVRKAQALQELQAIEAAKVQAADELKRIRAEKRQAKKAPSNDDEEQEKVIDENDPDAKPWIKRINDTVSPVQEEIEKEKAEVRQFAIDEFLATRPALAKNPEKLKELMGVYERLHTATERNKEGVLRDLDKAYAVVYHQELLEAAQQTRVDSARRDAVFSQAAVSRGSTAYTAPKEARVKLTPEEEKWAVKFYGSIEEYSKIKAEQDKKAAEETV